MRGDAARAHPKPNRLLQVGFGFKGLGVLNAKDNWIEDADAKILFEAWVALQVETRPSSNLLADTSTLINEVAEAALLAEWKRDKVLTLRKMDLSKNLLTQAGISEMDEMKPPDMTLLVHEQKDHHDKAGLGSLPLPSLPFHVFFIVPVLCPRPSSLNCGAPKQH